MVSLCTPVREIDLFVTRPWSLVFRSDLAIDQQKRASASLLVLIVFELLLILATWPLWWGMNAFPKVPLLNVEVSCGNLPAVVLLATLVLLLWQSVRTRLKASFSVFLLCLSIGAAFWPVLIDQHRLQPWHWLFVLNLGWALLPQSADRLSLMRHTAVTVYVCSALSRMTPVPDESITGVIVGQLLNLAGLESKLAGSAITFRYLCHIATAGEFLIGVLLCLPKFRSKGCVAAVLMHASLLLALGPLGLNHHRGVLLWNVCFMFLIPSLFWGRDRSLEVVDDRRPMSTQLLKTAIWFFPLSGLIGFADNWPSWQLYSSRPETWVLFVHESDRSHIPVPLQSFVGEPSPLSHWCPVKLDRWSLAQTESPMYPEDRFQLAIIRAILGRCQQPVRSRIEISSPSSPYWWYRETSVIESERELWDASLPMSLNFTAREIRDLPLMQESVSM